MFGLQVKVERPGGQKPQARKVKDCICRRLFSGHALDDLENVEEDIDDIEIEGEGGEHVLLLRNLNLAAAAHNHLSIDYKILQ